MAHPNTTHVHLVCGCLVGEDGAVVLCPKGDELARRNGKLFPPLYDDDEAAWEAYNAALEEYRRHVRIS